MPAHFEFNLGASFSGVMTNVIKIKRMADGKFFDFVGLTFVTSGGTETAPLPEDTAGGNGYFHLDIASTPSGTWTDGDYRGFAIDVSGTLLSITAIVMSGGNDATVIPSVISGSDPLAVAIPGSYAPGTAGYVLGGHIQLPANGLDIVKGWGTWSFRQTIQAVAQFLLGKRSGMPTAGSAGTATYQDNASVAYGTVSFDTNGNVTASAITPPA